MSPAVTVLTTVYNGLPYLREAVESVFAQTFSDFEYLIVDDASTDASSAYLASLSDPRVRVLTNPKNLGTAGSMNRGITEARARIIMRLDQDDVSLPTRLQRQLAHLDAHPEVAIVCTFEHTIDGAGRVLRSWRTTVANRGEFLGPILLGLCPIWHPSIMVRKAAMDRIGGFIPASWPAEDFDVTMRLALAGFGAAVVPEFLVLQRQHGRRQSIQSESKQKAAMSRLHTEMIASFCPDASRISALAAFLRQESTERTWGRSKVELLTLLECLKQTLDRMGSALGFTLSERGSMERILRRRLGWGPIIGPHLYWLPTPFWFFSFYIGSPLFLPRLRRVLSTWYRVLCECRHPRQFFVRGGQ